MISADPERAVASNEFPLVPGDDIEMLKQCWLH